MMTRGTIPSWREFVSLPDDELGRYDIAAVNLACAVGLPGWEKIDYADCLSKLDVWATCVQLHTARLLPQFHRKPHEYENSEAYFRALAMITVLQRDLGVRYNPAKIPADAPFDTADTFIHGITHGNGGTCATMPVVYAAVGRRLGYPIRVVSTRGRWSSHLFARWDDPARGDRFNIEATNLGLSTPTDDEMRTGRYQLTATDEREGCYLRSMTPRMELANFLGGRGWCFEDIGDWRHCVEAWAWASSLVPENVHTRNSLKRCLYTWDQNQVRRQPAGFPLVMLHGRGRLYPALPLDIEKYFFGLVAVENMLTDPRMEAKYWGPMRRGDFSRFPVAADAYFAEDASCVIDLRFDA